MTYLPPGLRENGPTPTAAYLPPRLLSNGSPTSRVDDDLARRRKREYEQAGAPQNGEVDKSKLVPNVYFFRRRNGTEGLGIWWTDPHTGKGHCQRLKGMPTIAHARREAERQRAGVSPPPETDQTERSSVDAADAASRYLVDLRRNIRRPGAAGANDTRGKIIEPATWDKKRSIFATLGLRSDLGGLHPELLGEGRTMTARERSRRAALVEAAAETSDHDAGPLSGYALAEIDEEALIHVIDYLTEAGNRPETTMSYLGELRRFIGFCIRARQIDLDPFVRLSPNEIPALTRRRKRALTLNEQRRLLEALPDFQHRLGALFDLNVGVRIGERLDLVWVDLDLDNHIVHVDSTTTRSGRHRPTKTSAGVRDVPFSPDVADALRQWRRDTPAPRPHDPVWCRPDGRPYTTDAFRKQIIAPAIQAAALNDGLDRRLLQDAARWVTQHSLRHTYASVLLSDPQINLATASALLGHAHTAVTQIVYWHYINEDRQHNPVRLTIERHVRELVGDNTLEFLGR